MLAFRKQRLSETNTQTKAKVSHGPKTAAKLLLPCIHARSEKDTNVQAAYVKYICYIPAALGDSLYMWLHPFCLGLRCAYYLPGQ